MQITYLLLLSLLDDESYSTKIAEAFRHMHASICCIWTVLLSRMSCCSLVMHSPLLCLLFFLVCCCCCRFCCCRDAMIELGCACDGGKDSLSMAAAAGGETVMAPGNLVVSAYVGCPDVTQVVTPDLKLSASGGLLLHVDLADTPGARRLGGSALAQAYSQVGDDCPDAKPAVMKAAWGAVQALIKQGIVSAGHDVSDGGIATTLLEMAFAGATGCWAVWSVRACVAHMGARAALLRCCCCCCTCTHA
jgi:AIR synthase related protein, C-terminal domain